MPTGLGKHHPKLRGLFCKLIARVGRTAMLFGNPTFGGDKCWSAFALPIIKYYHQMITHNQVITMRVTSKGQVTIPQYVRENMGILVAETEIEFLQDENGRWYLNKSNKQNKITSRFRSAHKAGTLTMSTDEIMALTRS